MRYASFVGLSVAVLFGVMGCSQSGSDQAAGTSRPQPAQTASVTEQPLDPAVAKAIGATTDTFMRSILSGDSARAATLLTTAATQRYQSNPGVLSSMGMRVERLEVGEVRLLSDAEAAAQCLVYEPGATAPQELCCLLKLEASGWRVCGVACDAGGEGPAVISFEDEPEAPATQFVEAPDEIWNAVPHTAAGPSTGEIR